MRARLAHPFAIALAMLSTFGAAHVADRVAYGLQMQARGLEPVTERDAVP